MKEREEGVVRYIRSRNSMPQIRHFEEGEGFLLPINALVKRSVHDQIATSGDNDVVIALNNYAQGLERFKLSELPDLEHDLKKILSIHGIDDETPEITYKRIKANLISMRLDVDLNTQRVADYAYKFGFGTAYDVFVGNSTGDRFPSEPSSGDVKKQHHVHRKIMDIAGLYVEWNALAALDKDDFQLQNNPFEPILHMVEIGEVNFERLLY